jgi:EmrB/QacA subfamily drug resistance transporter
MPDTEVMTKGGGEPAQLSNPPLSRREFRFTIFSMTVVMLFSSLDQSIVSTALPRIASDLGELSHISWVITAFMLCATVSTPLYGKLGDMYGRRPLLIASICIALLGSLICAFATSMLQLILARGLQGLGSGGLLILVQTVIAQLVPPRERGRYVGVTTGAITMGNLAGPIVGGWITQTFSWRWIFLANLPVGVLALMLITTGLRRQERTRRHGVDVLGAMLLSTGAVSTLLLLSWAGSVVPWLSWSALLLAMLGAAGFLAFYRWERRAKEPLVDLELLRVPDVLPSCITSGLTSFAMMAMLVFVPLYLQLVRGLTPVEAGLATLPQIATMLASSLLFGPVSSRYGRPKLTMISGILVQIVAIAALAIIAGLGEPLPWLLVALGLFGLGQGIAMPSATLIVQAVCGQGRLGVATSTIAFIRSMGASTGLAVSGGVMAAVLGGELARLPVDATKVKEAGVGAIAALPTALRAEVIHAYGIAITGSFVVSLVAMLLALVTAFAVRDLVLSHE